MAIYDYWTTQVQFEQLKNIRNCTITFEKNLVGILGINGSGKSTILHALACMYKPAPERQNYKFSYFFTPNTHARWNGSKMTLYDTYMEDGNPVVKPPVVFEKESRWTPKYDRRQERYVSFIGIKTCVPIIEIESQDGKINLQTTALNGADDQKIREIASYVLNRDYEEYNSNKAHHRNYIGVRHNGIIYCALSMGAGEQRVFAIIEQIVKAPNGSLILIDEIDLLLHRDALRKLLGKANELAVEKKLQVVFTTHNHSILNLDFIQFHHLFQAPDRTLCLENANPDVMYRLTGEAERPISVYVEDDLSKALIKQIVAQLQMKKSVQVEIYGAASNCFTCAAGVILMGLEQNGKLFVLDGDKHKSPEDKITQLKKSLTGTEQHVVDRRSQALALIKQFVITDGIKPERYYHQCIINTPDDRLSEEELEYKRAAQEIAAVGDDHMFLSDIIKRIGESRETGLKIITQILSKSGEWDAIVSEIKPVLEEKKRTMNL